MRFILMLFVLLIGCVGVPVDKVETALALNEAEATVYADLAGFTRRVLMAGQQASPADQKQFWIDSLEALDENVEQFAQGNRDLMRLIFTMKEIDPKVQQDLFDKLTTLIIMAKTGERPEPEVE